MGKKMGRYIYRGTIILILILNIIILARVLEVIYLPGELTPLEKARQGAQAVINYSEELAKSYGVEKQKAVIDLLARFRYEIDKAENAEEVASLMLDYGRQTQDTILQEVQNKRLKTIINIINSQELPEEGHITISKIDDQVKILDPDGILREKTKEAIRKISFNQTLEIKIKQKRPRLVTTGDIFNQVDYLQTKVASLERELKDLKQKAGYAPLAGPGLEIKVFDNTGLDSTGIVHDSDIRDIINELVIAGARGIEVGGERITVHSAVRCVGPTILVNNRPIPVNPVVIKVVGEPRILASSLEIIKKQLNSFGIKMVIEKMEEIMLKGYSNE